MRRDVIIQNDPPALLQYRMRVQPVVVQNCAVANCHAPGSTKSKFQLVVPADSDAATYTNFYLLSTYQKRANPQSDAVFGSGDARMIDRAQPARSIVLQYGLPGAIAESDHPDVAGFRPPFRGVNDAKYVSILNWISQTLVPVDPDYGFSFGAAATQPATTQSAPAETQTPGVRPATRPMTRPAAPVRSAPPVNVRPVPPPPAPARPAQPAQPRTR
jgi:hypothetical protein